MSATENHHQETHPSALTDSKLDAMPGHLIRRLHQIAVGTFASELIDIGITPVQFAALKTIAANAGIDQRTLAQRIALDTSTTAGVIDRLETRGTVERRNAPNDRRLRVLYITPAGIDLLHAAHPLVDNVQSLLVAPLNEQEQAIFLTLLGKLVDANNALSRAPSVRASEGTE